MERISFTEMEPANASSPPDSTQQGSEEKQTSPEVRSPPKLEEKKSKEKKKSKEINSARRLEKILKDLKLLKESKKRAASSRQKVAKKNVSQRGVKSSRRNICSKEKKGSKEKRGSNEENQTKTNATQDSEEEKVAKKILKSVIKSKVKIFESTVKEKSKKRTKAHKKEKKDDEDLRTAEAETVKQEEIEELQRICGRHWPVKYNTNELERQMREMCAKNMERSLLSIADHVIRFQPQSSSTETCYHLHIHNPTDDFILFQVGSPSVAYLIAKPKIGYLAPKKHCTIFLLFTFRQLPRLPDDLVFAYKIAQQRIDTKHLKDLEADEKDYTTRRMRKITRQSKFTHFWQVATCFYAGDPGEVDYSCGTAGIHSEKAVPQLDNQGQIFEANYNPDEHDDKSENLPSAED